MLFFLLRFSLPRLGNSPSLPEDTFSSHLDPEGCFSLWMPLLPHLGWLLWCGQPPHVLKALTFHTRLPPCWTSSSLGWTQATLLRAVLTCGPSLLPGLGPGLEHHSCLPFRYRCLSSCVPPNRLRTELFSKEWASKGRRWTKRRRRRRKKYVRKNIDL